VKKKEVDIQLTSWLGVLDFLVRREEVWWCGGVGMIGDGMEWPELGLYLYSSGLLCSLCSKRRLQEVPGEFWNSGTLA